MSNLRNRLEKMEKTAVEILNDTEAKKSFLQNMDEIIKGLDDAVDDCSRSLMELRRLENDHYLMIQEDVFNYIDDLMDKLETESEKIKNMKDKIEFKYNH